MNFKPLALFFTLALALLTGFAPSAYAVDECSQASFKVSSSLSLETAPLTVKSADFNGDGHLDLVAAVGNSSEELVILFGNGGQDSFGPPINIPTEVGSKNIELGDFNGDGKVDLIISRRVSEANSVTLTVLLNNGSGVFSPATPINVPGVPYRPIVTDFNNDGKPDLLLGLSSSSSDAKVLVFLGDGAGNFTQTTNPPLTANSINTSSIIVGDFNEDGRKDFLTSSTSPGVGLFAGNGDGSFAPPLDSPSGDFLYGSFVAADFNGDGHLDIASGSYNSFFTSRLYVMKGDGAGRFAAPGKMNIPARLGFLETHDINGDGKPDMVFTSDSNVSVLPGDGTGNFGNQQTLYAAGPSLTAPVFGDFNEDGKVDIAVGQGLTSGNYSIEILYGEGAGASPASLSVTSNVSRPRDMVAADFNNDGNQDFATVSSDYMGGTTGGSSVGVSLGDGTGKFTNKPLTLFFGGTMVSSLATGDFNNDGKVDLAVTLSTHAKVSILLNDGSGGFPADGFSAPSFSTSSWGYQPTKIKASDFNNDGNTDLVVFMQGSDNLLFVTGDGSLGFNIIQALPLQGTSSFMGDLETADFNGDGKLDLTLVRSSRNEVSVLKNTSTPIFSTYATLPVPGTPLSAFATDLNADGKPDLAVTSSTVVAGNPSVQQGYVSIFINNGANSFNPRVDYKVDGPGILGAGDFNADAVPDLALSSGNYLVGGKVTGFSVLNNDGAGAFSAPVNFTAGPGSYDLVVRDFNKDGKDDVLFTQPSAHSVALSLNNFSGVARQCLSVNDVTVTEGDTGTTDAVFTVKLSGASAQTVRVNYFIEAPYQYQGLPLKKGIDLESVHGTLIFQPGVTTQTVTVPVKGDTVDEFDETFYLRLSTPVNAIITDIRGAGTIIDNDAAPSLSINDAVIAESLFYNSSMTFTVTLSAATEKPITVQYATSNGTATASSDFYNNSGKLEFPAGTTSNTIKISGSTDNIFEADETLFVNLSDAVNASIADGEGLGTITNDDPQPNINLPASNYRSEGAAGTSVAASFEVRLTNPSSFPITVAYTTTDGTATAGSDYVATSGMITFGPGEMIKPVSLQVKGDDVDETNETLFVDLSSPTNATIATGRLVVTIQDDDGPSITISNATVTEGNTGYNEAVFIVALSASSVQDVIANYETINGTASSFGDYQQANKFISFVIIPAGSTSGTIKVRIFTDYQIEPDETFTVSLSSPINGTIAKGQATGTITNDDAPGKLQFSNQTYSADEKEGSVNVSVTRTEGGSGTVTVDYSTSNGTAQAGLDYTATSGTLTFNQGEISKSFSIPVSADGVNEGDETINLTLSNAAGGASLVNPTTAVLTIKGEVSAPHLILEESGADPNQAVAMDATLLLRDPFPVVNAGNLLNPDTDKNTRVIVFVMNLQVAQGETASSVVVNLTDATGLNYEVEAEDSQPIPLFNFTQLRFRLPDNLAPGTCTIKVKAHGQESNSGTIKIKN